MKKILLFIFLIVCWPNFSMAEDIQNMDTPVNWSYTALFHTIWDFHKDDDIGEHTAGRYLAEELLYLYVEEKRPVSARWICDNYYTYARDIKLKPHNCYDVIAKLIENHNTEVRLKTQLKPIDKYLLDEKVYWNPVAITNACTEITSQYEREMLEIVEEEGWPSSLAVNQAVVGYDRCIWLKYEFELYSKPYSIDELYEYCTSEVYMKYLGKTYEHLCSAWIDFAIEQHNELVQNTQSILGAVK